MRKRKRKKHAPEIRFYKHISEEKYLRVEGEQMSQYTIERRGNSVTQKIVHAPDIPVLAIGVFYRQISHWQFTSALYNGHTLLFMFENGQKPNLPQHG